MDIIDKALEFENISLKSLSTSDRVRISREAKDIILSLNEIYRENKDSDIMAIMKRITIVKKKVEKRLLKVPRV